MGKVCNKCKIDLPLSDFGKNKPSKDGLFSSCKACERIRGHIRRSTTPDIFRERDKLRRSNNPTKFREQGRARYINNPEAKKISVCKWRSNNLAQARSSGVRYRLYKALATPFWLSSVEKAQIQEFYDIALAKSVQTGILHQVDHIHPLKGNGFIGLHVPWNLQVLTMSENISKRNHMPSYEAHLLWSY